MEIKSIIEIIDNEIIQYKKVSSVQGNLGEFSTLWTLENYSGEIFEDNSSLSTIDLSVLEFKENYITNFISSSDILHDLDFLHEIKDNVDDINYINVQKALTKYIINNRKSPNLESVYEYKEFINNLESHIKQLQ